MCFSVANGQTLMERARTAEYRYDFLEAAKLYEKAYYKNKNYRNAIKVARCKNELHNYKGVIYWCQIARKHHDLISSDKLMYALALTDDEQYDSAKVWFRKHQKEDSENDISRNYYRFLVNMSLKDNEITEYKVKKFYVSTDKPEFSPVPYKDGIAFLSPHKGRAAKRTHMGYYDLKYFSMTEDSILPAFSDHINSKFHEGPASFAKNSSVIYFTRNNYYHNHTTVSNSNVVDLGIYKSTFKGETWGKESKINLTSKEISIAHPSVTNDEKMMFFTSRDPDGSGAYDLCLSVDTGRGFSEYKNLGSKINTSGNEVFPWYDQENNVLYFASDGLGGYGGLDIFVAQLDQNYEVVSVKNMGLPVNSSKDDMSFCFSDEKIGYFSSDRSGNDDIYTFSKIEDGLKIEGIVYDRATNRPLPNTKVSVFNDEQSIDLISTDAGGRYSMQLREGEKYTFMFDKLKYAHRVDTILLDEIVQDRGIKTYLEPAYFKLIGNVHDEYGVPFVDDEIVLSIEDSCSGEKKEILPNVEGQFVYDLEADCKYVIKGEKEGYFTYSAEFSTEGIYNDVYEDIMLRKIVIDQTFKVNHVYFDRRKADLRPESRYELSKLVRLLNDNPSLIVELGSHTDARGDDDYNFDLSKRRSESVMYFLYSNGISPDRIKAKGYGETTPVNNCVDGIPCTEDDHQRNRRTEIKVIGMLNQ